jgi:RNA polymerase sigma-70 factor (TIGR02960 family)
MYAPTNTMDPELLARARAGDSSAFEKLTTPHRRALHLHCYRMLGSPHDADDAVQETLIAAWKALDSFEGRSALGTWLYQISTRVCLRMISQRPRRQSSPDHAPALTSTEDLGQPVAGPVWIEPLPDDEGLVDEAHDDDPLRSLQRRENVALAFVAALQHLPGTQRAVLLLREVLEYSAVEAAETLDTSVASVNSALQRAQKTVKEKMSGAPQAAQLEVLGEARLQKLLGDFMSAWESRNVSALVGLLTEDARFTMPPLPAWFDGRVYVEKFIAERMFATAWRLRPVRANGQPGFACYMQAPDTDTFRLGAVNLLSFRDGRIAGIHGFLEPAVLQRFGLPMELA